MPVTVPKDVAQNITDKAFHYFETTDSTWEIVLSSGLIARLDGRRDHIGLSILWYFAYSRGMAE